MLKQDSGEYACIAEDRSRYNLGELKEELQAAMGLDTEEEGSAMQVCLGQGGSAQDWGYSLTLEIGAMQALRRMDM
jgi:hypothetical protein